MAFQRGHPKLGGRRRGVSNKTTAEMRAWAAELITDLAYRESLRRRLLKGRAGRIEPLLWQYACGRPAGSSAGTDSDATHYAEILNRIQRCVPRDSLRRRVRYFDLAFNL
jgi:hypothetical protein